jgi:hypothetical protein
VKNGRMKGTQISRIKKADQIAVADEFKLNGSNMNNVRYETSRNFRNKRRKFQKY